MKNQRPQSKLDLARAEFDAVDWTERELAVFRRLKCPEDIQQYLDSIGYNYDTLVRAPRGVIKVRRAKCYDGALFAATALRRIGYPPLLIDLKAERDSDHVIALFMRNGCYGAISKSSFVSLRFREPVYRSLRELAMSYFDSYFNFARQRTLRSYSLPFDLLALDHLNWMIDPDALEEVAQRLDSSRHFALMSPRMIKQLNPIARRTFRAACYGVRRKRADVL